MQHWLRFWLPNLLSILRIVLVVPYLFGILHPTSSLLNFVLALVIVLTDIVDGYLARKLKATSVLGSVLDSIGDTAFLWGTWIAFFFVGLYDGLILTLLLLPRIFTLLTIILQRLRKKHWNVNHLWSDKMAGLAHCLAIFWILLHGPFWLEFLYAMMAVNYACIIYGLLERQSQASREDDRR
ncbi:MAG: CDP-alcohol phosphatidyltransferase family protein [Patescibacteria group bacterium]